MQKVIDNLLAAKAKLSQGWCKHYFFLGPNGDKTLRWEDRGRAEKCCLNGAVAIVIDVNPLMFGYEDYIKTPEHLALYAALKARGYTDGRFAVEFANNEADSVEDIYNLIDEAIALCKTTHPDMYKGSDQWPEHQTDENSSSSQSNSTSPSTELPELG